MNQTLFITLAPFLVSLIISLVSTPLLVLIFNKFGWVIDPKKNPHPAHIHKEPVPKGGGIPVFLALVVTSLFFLKSDKHIDAILIAASITVFIGVIDDIKGLNPYARLVSNFVAAIIIVASGIGISFVTNPAGGIIDISGWFLADLFALIWIPSLMNAINWSSGVDGQISGVVTIAALFLGAVSLSYSADITQWPVAILAFSLAGAFAGLTVFHFFPQKIMPGYSATSLAGLMLGVISILATGKVGTALMVLAIPLIDFGYIIIRRMVTGKSPVWGDKDHLHHKLLQMGWGKRRVALFYWGITLVLGIVALNFEARFKILIMIALVLLMAIFWIWQYSGRFSKH
jgi:UDP-GlcNAc:undecaprenyl-phosphate GlcNAc-1-phosphate transferase